MVIKTEQSTVISIVFIKYTLNVKEHTYILKLYFCLSNYKIETFDSQLSGFLLLTNH